MATATAAAPAPAATAAVAASATPVATPYASASLYVGDLQNEVTEALLFEIFNAVGPVASVRVCRDAATRRSLGYAYVNFHRVEDAERALDLMNFKDIRNKPCRIMWSHRDPSLRKSGLGNIFVKNLAKTIDNKSLYDTFSMFGNILSCKVAMNSQGHSLGYGFVHYESEESAQSAITQVNNKMIAGSKVTVSAFKSRKERGGNTKFKFTNVYCKNLPAEIDDTKLREMFAEYGEITSSAVKYDKDGTHRGFGFVNFKTCDEAQAAVEGLNETEVGEKKLYVVRAQKKEEREKELRQRFEQLKVERQKKYAGVNLYVKNLSDQIDDAKLSDQFAKFGAITSARVMMDQHAKSKGFGFVCFSAPEEATKAVAEMNGRMLDNKPLYVALAQRKEVRRQQLEQQHSSGFGRGKMGVPMNQPAMFPGAPVPGGPQPVFYQNAMQRNFVYPPPMMRQWPAQGGGSGPGQMMRGAPPMNYQLMPINQRSPGGGRGGRGGRGGGRGGGPKGQGQGPQGQNFKYADNVRNRDQRPQQPNPQPSANMAETVVHAGMAQPLTTTALAAAPEDQRKQMIGERLFPLIKQQRPNLAGKITGMLLEMDNGELLNLLESQGALSEKIEEAITVLQNHEQEAANAL